MPPPVLAAACAAIAWWLPQSWRMEVPSALRWAGIVLAMSGLLLNAWPKRFFRRQGTTANPLHPDRSTALVTGGPYRWSRNPMYVGYAVFLAGWGLWLAQPAALACVILFVGWIDRLQIPAEEDALQARFGTTYADYRHKVRRWL